ncbi:MAG TPA: 5-oxoprolinase subunit PxpB [Vicinamibacterales bacterium]
MTCVIREAGDSAMLLELEEVIDAGVNARAIAIAAALRAEAPAGVRDVVSTYRTVAVHFDPLQVDVEAMRAAMTRASTTPATDLSGQTVDVPVQYGGEAGPDLLEVAQFASLSPSAAIGVHSDTPYRVFMLGFLPGFAYMGSVDETIAMPRRETPRVRVPTGSVGIAGLQTGVYPRESPGGWRLIGRTNARVFDASRARTCLFAPGDVVRFTPADRLEFDRPRSSATPSNGKEGGRRHVTVVRPGLFTTIQDRGRWGHQANGVPVGGALDRVSHSAANALVGNDAGAATLEVTLLGPELRLESEAVVAVTGADLGARVDGSDVTLNSTITCRPGAVLRFGERRSGSRAYVAVDGGIDVDPVLGSRATSVLCGLGGVDGRAIVAGDRLPLGAPARPERARRRLDLSPVPHGGARLRVLPGPHQDFFPDEAFDHLQRGRFIVTPRSDRMGYRLEGARLRRIEKREMISDAAFIGGIQVPSSGEPILLMSDRQTTGGYPQIATVITADLPLAGQLAPGDWIEFEICSRRDALQALVAQEGRLLAIR